MAIVLKTISDSAQAQKDLARLRQSVDEIRKSTNKVSDSFASLNTAFKIGTIGAAVTGYAKISDTITNLNSRLKVATDSQNEFYYATGRVTAIALKTRASLESTANLYSRISIASKSFGASQTEVAKVTELVAKAMASSGSSLAEQQAATMQFGQALASGKFAGDELRSILENSTSLSMAIAKGLGVSVTQLKDMGEKGQLVSSEVFQAILDQQDEINKKFGMMKITYSGAMVNLKNSFLLMFKSLSENLFNIDFSFAELINKIAIKIANFASNFGLRLLKLELTVAVFVIRTEILFRTLFDVIKEKLKQIDNLFGNIFSKTYEKINGLFSKIKENSMTVTAAIMAVFTNFALMIKSGEYKAALLYLVTSTKNGIKKIIDYFRSIDFSAGFKRSIDLIKKFFDGLYISVKNVADKIAKIFDKLGLSGINRFASNLVGSIKNIGASIKRHLSELNVGRFIPSLSGALATVKNWAIKVERWFYWVYDKVIGRSWIPDLVTGVLGWFKRLGTGSKSLVGGFASQTSNAFKGLATKTKSLFGFGLITRGFGLVTKSVIGLVKVLTVFALLWKGLELANKNELGVKFSNAKDKSINILTKIYEKVKEFAKRAFKSFEATAVGQKVVPFVKDKIAGFNNRFGQEPIVRTFKQVFGIQDKVEGSLFGEKIDTNAFVGRGRKRNDPNRRLGADIIGAFPREYQTGFVVAATAAFALAATSALSAGPVRKAVVSIITSLGGISLFENVDKEDRDKFFGGAANSFLQTVSFGIKKIFKGNVLFRDSGGGLIDDFKLSAKKAGEFLSFAAKSALIFAKGREVAFKALQAGAIAPTKAALTTGSAIEARYAARRVREADANLRRFPEIINENFQRATANQANARNNLANFRVANGGTLGAANANALVNNRQITSNSFLGPNASQAQRQAFAAAVQQARAAEDALAEANRQTTRAGRQQALAEANRARDRLEAKRAAFADKVDTARENLRATTRNVIAGSAGFLGAVSGLQIGTEIADGMTNASGWQKVAVTMGTTIALQMAASGVGTAISWSLEQGAGFLTSRLGAMFSAAFAQYTAQVALATTSQGFVTFQQRLAAFGSAAGSLGVALLRFVAVGAVIAAAIWAAVKVFNWASKLFTATPESTAADNAAKVKQQIGDFQVIGKANGGIIQAFASGGHVRGPGTGTSDSIPAKLSNGEFVVNAKDSKKNINVLEYINSGKSILDLVPKTFDYSFPFSPSKINTAKTTEEENAIGYSRKWYKDGSYQVNFDKNKNPDSITSFKGMITGEDNNYKLIPSFWNGKVQNELVSEILAEKSGIKFPHYNNLKTAINSENRLHETMSADSSVWYDLLINKINTSLNKNSIKAADGGAIVNGAVSDKDSQTNDSKQLLINNINSDIESYKAKFKDIATVPLILNDIKSGKNSNYTPFMLGKKKEININDLNNAGKIFDLISDVRLKPNINVRSPKPTDNLTTLNKLDAVASHELQHAIDLAPAIPLLAEKYGYDKPIEFVPKKDMDLMSSIIHAKPQDLPKLTQKYGKKLEQISNALSSAFDLVFGDAFSSKFDRLIDQETSANFSSASKFDPKVNNENYSKILQASQLTYFKDYVGEEALDVKERAKSKKQKITTDQIIRKVFENLNSTNPNALDILDDGMANNSTKDPEIAFKVFKKYVDLFSGKDLKLTESFNKEQDAVMKFATGGHVRGPGSSKSDSIPAMLSNGEFVVNAKSTKENRGLLEAINSGKQTSFLAGGTESTGAKVIVNPYLEVLSRRLLTDSEKLNTTFINSLDETLSDFNREFKKITTNNALLRTNALDPSAFDRTRVIDVRKTAIQNSSNPEKSYTTDPANQKSTSNEIEILQNYLKELVKVDPVKAADISTKITNSTNNFSTGLNQCLAPLKYFRVEAEKTKSALAKVANEELAAAKAKRDAALPAIQRAMNNQQAVDAVAQPVDFNTMNLLRGGGRAGGGMMLPNPVALQSGKLDTQTKQDVDTIQKAKDLRDAVQRLNTIRDKASELATKDLQGLENLPKYSEWWQRAYRKFFSEQAASVKEVGQYSKKNETELKAIADTLGINFESMSGNLQAAAETTTGAITAKLDSIKESFRKGDTSGAVSGIFGLLGDAVSKVVGKVPSIPGFGSGGSDKKSSGKDTTGTEGPTKDTSGDFLRVINKPINKNPKAKGGLGLKGITPELFTNELGPDIQKLIKEDLDLFIEVQDAAAKGIESAVYAFPGLYDDTIKKVTSTIRGAIPSDLAEKLGLPEVKVSLGDAYEAITKSFPGLNLSFEEFVKSGEKFRKNLYDQSAKFDSRVFDLNSVTLPGEQSAVRALDLKSKEIEDTARKLVEGIRTPFEMFRIDFEKYNVSIDESVYNALKGSTEELFMNAFNEYKTVVETLKLPAKDLDPTLRRQLQARVSYLDEEMQKQMARAVAELNAVTKFDKAKINFDEVQIDMPREVYNVLPDKMQEVLDILVKQIAADELILKTRDLPQKDRVATQTRINENRAKVEDIKSKPEEDRRKSEEAGMQFAENMKEGFSSGLKDVIKGRKSFKSFLTDIVDRFTDNIIDTWVDGLTDKLMGKDSKVFDMFKGLGKFQFDGGKKAGGLFGKYNEKQVTPELSKTSNLMPGENDYLKNKFGSDIYDKSGTPTNDFGLPPLGRGRFGLSLPNSDLEMANGGLGIPGINPINEPASIMPKTTDLLGLPEAPAIDVPRIGSTPSLMPESVMQGDIGLPTTDLTTGISDALGSGSDMLKNAITAGSEEGAGGFKGAFDGLLSMFKGGGGGGGGPGALGAFGGIIGSVLGGLFADGGEVSGPGTSRSDSIPAMLSNGEFVMNAKATRTSLPLLKALNNGQMPKLADGGMIGNTPIMQVPQMAPLKIENSGAKGSSQQIINLSVTGDISRQTRAQIMGMLPTIAGGVNMHNKERNYKG